MFFDIGIGMVTAVLLANFFSLDLNSHWVVFAITFSLLPDVDMVAYGVRKFFSHKHIYNHRSLTHYPAFYLPLTVAVYFFFGLPYSILFLLCVYLHLIHDTFWLGWGISWLWPLSTRKFKFFPDKDGKISSQILLTWNREDEEELFKKYHNPNWVRDFYCRPNIIAYVEYSVFIIALIVLLNSL
jgi:hypothetical protein